MYALRFVDRSPTREDKSHSCATNTKELANGAMRYRTVQTGTAVF